MTRTESQKTRSQKSKAKRLTGEARIFLSLESGSSKFFPRTRTKTRAGPGSILQIRSRRQPPTKPVTPVRKTQLSAVASAMELGTIVLRSWDLNGVRAFITSRLAFYPSSVRLKAATRSVRADPNLQVSMWRILCNLERDWEVQSRVNPGHSAASSSAIRTLPFDRVRVCRSRPGSNSAKSKSRTGRSYESRRRFTFTRFLDSGAPPIRVLLIHITESALSCR
jgi:hypothetical protein